MSPIVVHIPGAKILSSTGAGANGRQHRFRKAADVKRQREGANVSVVKRIHELKLGYSPTVDLQSKPPRFFTIPLLTANSVVVTRTCPRRYFADRIDNLRAMLKPTLDGIADALRVNDALFYGPGEPPIDGGVLVRCEQEAGPWGLRITIETA